MIINNQKISNKRYKINIVLDDQIKSIEYRKPKKYTHVSRYANTRRIYDKHNGIYYHETVSNYKISKNPEDTFVTVDLSNNRLDIISNNVYGISTYWWVIAMANNIIDAFQELPVGTVLRVPPLVSMYRKGNVIER